MINPWKVLGVHRKSTLTEIHKAYIELAKKNHPDLGGDVAKFQEVSEAHEMLESNLRIRHTVQVVFDGCRTCGTCKGSGVKTKSKSLTEKLYVACVACGGSGFNIKEGENNVIEL